MKKINKYIFLMVATVAFLFTACDEDDNTGFSGMVPTSPTISVDVPAGGVNLLEAKTTYLFDVTLSEAQVADVSIYISTIAGTATEGADFTIDNGNSRVFIPAGKTTGTVSITVLEDELLEDTETFTIQIGDERTANAEITPVTVDFTLTNLTADDLVMNLSWATNVADAVGIELDADKVVDMRLLVTDMDGNIIDSEDGSSFEEFVLTASDWADGQYIIATDIFATIDAGDFSKAVTLDLDLEFNQVGKINEQSFSFPAAMTNDFPCSAYRTNLATVTKSGSIFTIERELSFIGPPNDPWYGTDAGYDSQVTTAVGCDMLVAGLVHGWMFDFWGEEVIKEELVVINIDEDAGTVVIEEQDYITTLYDGDEYPYTIEGTGTYDNSGAFPTMTIVYEVFQDGFSPSKWAFDNGYMSESKFTATLTMDPVGLPLVPPVAKSAKTLVKPVR